ncbi:TBC1 domain family member 19-like isoform X1 [Clavelina lepadiformis]|uniref:Rab-GAP TBC domain-containing protein n=1 Tax=Clavelina lepadiformis TaxID=159417 RepID=A0ABP0FVR8_CLALP
MDPKINEIAASISEIVKKLNGSTLYSQLKRAAQKEVEKPTASLATLKTDVVEALKTSGWDRLLRNKIFAYLSSCQASLDQSLPFECQKEPLMYMRKAQANWERRILKSMNSMCTELSIPLARKRPPEEQRALLHKWNEMGTEEPDLSHFRPVYAPKDFLEVIISLRNPNYCGLLGPEVDEKPSGGHWGLIQVPLEIPKLKDLQNQFSEFAHGHGHAGVDDNLDVPSEAFQNERNKIAKKVLDEKRSVLAQYFCRNGCPSGHRAEIWQLALGVTVNHLDVLKYEQLKGYVLQHDLLVDSLIYKDVKLTAVNDDYYFVFEDYLYQVLLVFSRDTSVLNHFAQSSAMPPKSFIRAQKEPSGTSAEQESSLTEAIPVFDVDKLTSPNQSNFNYTLIKSKPTFPPHLGICDDEGKLGQDEYAVVYPPNGVIPFHGFSMYATPLCYLYAEPVGLYYIFRQFYTRYFHRLHAISSHPQGIVSLCLLFETTLQSLHPRLCRHLQEIGCQPLKIAFKWLVRAFAGYLATEQLLLLWDRVIGYGNLLLLPILAVAIFLFRQSNLFLITSASGVEASLADITTLHVVPLIQLVLFPT